MRSSVEIGGKRFDLASTTYPMGQILLITNLVEASTV
jgi:hypothetical protein